MMTAAAFGIGFAIIARSPPRAALLPVGTVYGLAAFAVSAFVGLPIAAAITDSGSPISDMARMVGWATFAVEHVLFGVVLGALARQAAGVEAPIGHTVDRRAAIMS